MTASTSAPLSAKQIQDAQNKAKALSGAGTKAVSNGQFVFFAAFDGTNNIKTDPDYSGDKQTTSLGQISKQFGEIQGENPNFKGGYYPGPGTPGTVMYSSWNPKSVTKQIQLTAQKAYSDFERQARAWLDADPSRSPADVTAMATGFSRGGPTAVVFTQILAERGLTKADGTVLIPPLDSQTGLGGVPVAGLLGIDNVSTGYMGDLRIRQNVNANNIVMVVAENEFRSMFPNDDYSNDPRVQTFGMVGNHGDAGAFYDNGLGGLSLQAQTDVLRNFGLKLADVPADRQFDASKPIVIHNEGVDSYGHRIWDEYGTPGNRLKKTIAGPVLNGLFDQDVLSVTAIGNGDQTMTQRITYKNGDKIYRVLDAQGNPLLTVMPGETLVRDPQSGTYTVSNPATQETSTYNPTTQAHTQKTAAGVDIAGNNATGEYQMRIPRADGNGYTDYSRTVNPEGGWLVAQVDVDSSGQKTYEFKGVQLQLNGDITALTEGWKTDTETGSSSWGGEDLRGVRTDAITAKATGITTIKSTDEATQQSKEVTVAPQKGMSEKDYNNAMYSSMAGFLAAMRGKDSLGMALNGAKMLVDTAIFKNDGTVPGNVLSGANTALAGISATVGVVAGLHALQSNDLQTQLSGAVGLLGSANTLQSVFNSSAGGNMGPGLLTDGQLRVLNNVGAVLAIANLKNLDTMMANGQVGSAAATVVAALNGAAYLAGSASALSGAGALIAVNPLVMVVAVVVLDQIFSGGGKAPPPPPPVGWAEFVRNAQGQLQYLYHGATATGQDLPGDKGLGNSILSAKMNEILVSLNKQLTDANATNTDPARALVLIASRLPKLYLQSWPSYDGNGDTNYYYYAEMAHAQTGQKYGAQVARQDIAKEFASLAVGPEAIVQQWQATHLAQKFGADDSKWLTEGQWANAQSPIEQSRTTLTKAYQDAYIVQVRSSAMSFAKNDPFWINAA